MTINVNDVVDFLFKAPTGNGFCVFNGRIYHKDDRWLDDCNNTCVCENALTGKYNCNNRYVNNSFLK